MQSSPNMQGYALPTNLDPPDTVCLTIEVPNDPAYIKAVIGALYDTTLWVSWQRDTQKRGVKAAQRMKAAWFKAIETIGKCLAPAFGSAGADDGSEFMIRQNPDNPCLLESSVNGTEWCVFADLSLCMNFGQQPGTGTTPPAPGGGTQETCAELRANGMLLLPSSVNSGDTVTLNDASGAGNDPDLDGYLLWRLPNGDQFFGGLDVGFPFTDPSDPLPSANHMQLILGIGGATTQYLALAAGVPVTIPSGVVNASIWIQVNDSALSDNSGSYNLCATVKNNNQGAWISTLDFTANSYSGFINDSFGTWTPGQGYSGGVNGSVPNFAQLDFTISAANIDVLSMFYDVASVGGSAQEVLFQCNAVTFGSPGAPNVGASESYTATGAATGVTSIVAVLSSGTTGGIDHIQKIVIQGHGTKPSQLP